MIGYGHAQACIGIHPAEVLSSAAERLAGGANHAGLRRARAIPSCFALHAELRLGARSP